MDQFVSFQHNPFTGRLAAADRILSEDVSEQIRCPISELASILARDSGDLDMDVFDQQE